MTPIQMCCTKYNMCNDKTDPIDFTIKLDREPVLKVNVTWPWAMSIDPIKIYFNKIDSASTGAKGV